MLSPRPAQPGRAAVVVHPGKHEDMAGFRAGAAPVLASGGDGTCLTCRELLVRASRAQPWQSDGEVMERTRQLRVTPLPGNLLVRVPAGTAD
jgi:hypothetical protein